MLEAILQDIEKLKIVQSFFNLFLTKKNTQIVLSQYHTAWYKYPDFASIVFWIRKPHVHIYLPEEHINFTPSHLNIPIFPPGEKYIRAYTKCMEYYGWNIEMIVYNGELSSDIYRNIAIHGLQFFDMNYETIRDGKNIDYKIKNCRSSACMQDAVRIVLYYTFLYAYIEKLTQVNWQNRLNDNILLQIFTPIDHERKFQGIGWNIGKWKRRGYARVLDRENLWTKNAWYNHFNTWDIIIAHSTDVYYMSYIFEAGWIVTENSNLLSHASLISRELWLPLVLGVENIFLKIFSWDLIEIDSDSWEIIILKRFWEE